MLTCDFPAIWRERAGRTGIAPDAWYDAFGRVAPTLGVGQMTMAEAFEVTLRTCGVTPSSELVSDLVNADQDLLLATARLYPDALPFLELLRSRGITIVIVSNCSENTRPLLTKLGVAAIADALVLSCEVGCIKPSRRIFRHALDEAGVPGPDALFVDDQAAFCAGGEMAGLRAVQIVRDGELPAGGVRSLLDLEPLLR
jgi:putative hydrolase of the HAD superfamily